MDSAMGRLISLSILLIFHNFCFTNAYFEGCDNTYTLSPNSVAYLRSPNFPSKYPAGSSCRYKLVAPLDYEIVAECNIAIDKGANACSSEYFYISREGISSLSGAEQFCGADDVQRTSLFRTLVFAYNSQAPANSNIGGTFNCKLTTRPQACDCGWSVNTRILGGVNTAIGEFPSTVALYHVPSRTVFCGGSIISHREVLTATHCTHQYPNPQDVLIIAGDYDLSTSNETPYAATYPVSSYTELPGYDAASNANDLTILHTSSDIEWSRGVGPICLPFGLESNTLDYQNVFIAGWGTTSFAGVRSNILKKAAVNIIPNSSCQTVYPSLQQTQVCTYASGKDACQFDSGGPVIYKGVREFLLGVISFGNGCGTDPGVNVRVTSYLNWIQSNSVGSICPKPFN